MYLDSPIGSPTMNFLPTALEWYGRDNSKGYGNDMKSGTDNYERYRMDMRVKDSYQGHGTDMRVWYNYEGYATDMSGSGQI